jgi:hypothetical protein
LNKCRPGHDPWVDCRLVLVVGTLLLVVGCRAKQQGGDSTLLDRISRVGHLKATTPKPGELAEKGRAAIADQCAKQSYQTASKGLIASEPGLHEDVFALRNRVSYGEMAYGLDEALRLDALLHAEANTLGHPPEQTACIEEFAEHLETLTDPMVEADQRLKELDASAFKDSEKEAQEQTEKTLHETEKPVDPRMQPPVPLPQ